MGRGIGNFLGHGVFFLIVRLGIIFFSVGNSLCKIFFKAANTGTWKVQSTQFFPMAPLAWSFLSSFCCARIFCCWKLPNPPPPPPNPLPHRKSDGPSLIGVETGGKLGADRWMLMVKIFSIPADFPFGSFELSFNKLHLLRWFVCRSRSKNFYIYNVNSKISGISG